MIAEILVLMWGLFVALARLMPGAAGQPIRALATLYCDVFRGIPGIVTLYLIGFGIPTSGIPDLIMPHVYGLFYDTSAMTPQELQNSFAHSCVVVVHFGFDTHLWCLCRRSLSRRN